MKGLPQNCRLCVFSVLNSVVSSTFCRVKIEKDQTMNVLDFAVDAQSKSELK